MGQNKTKYTLELNRDEFIHKPEAGFNSIFLYIIFTYLPIPRETTRVPKEHSRSGSWKLLVENLLYFGFKDGKQGQISKVSLHLEQCHAKLGPGQGLIPILRYDSMLLSLELAVFSLFPFLLLPMSFILFL